MPSRNLSGSAAEKLFALPDAYAHGREADDLFLASLREAALFHFRHNALFRALCKSKGWEARRLTALQDPAELPWLFVDVFKHHRLLSIPEEEVVFTFTSSGTGGTISQIMWDAASRERQSLMRARTIESLGLAFRAPARYAIFSYDYPQSGGRGAAYAHEMYSTFAPALEKWYALRIRHEGADFSFDLREAAEVLVRMAASGDPVRILGFPSFVYFTKEELARGRERLPLNPDSVIINGGGWKLHTGQEIRKDRYRRELAEFFALPEANIRDVFGMVEHGVPYVSCSHGNFHEPVYARILVRAPLTGELLPPGETGLLQFLSPYVRSMPAVSLLSSDLGYVTERCPCGMARPYFTVLRRGGTRVYKGCALTASELIG